MNPKSILKFILGSRKEDISNIPCSHIDRERTGTSPYEVTELGFRAHSTYPSSSIRYKKRLSFHMGRRLQESIST
jgi:hypothetical protein